MTYKLIVFDMGNTLLNFHAGEHTDQEKDIMGCKNMSFYLREKHNIDVTASMIKTDLIDEWYSDFYKRKALIELDVCVYVNDFLKTLGFESGSVNCRELMNAFYKPYMDEVVITDGALESVMAVKELMHVGVISNCILFDDFYEQTFKKSGLSNYIDNYIFSYSRQIRKPDKRLFNEMLDYHTCKAEDAIMVGDSYSADILPAKELGMKTIHFTSEPIKHSQADASVNRLNMIPKVIRQLNQL